LAGAIVLGVARSMVTLSAHADVFGVGITAMIGAMLVVASWVISGWIVPGGGLFGTWGVESGNAAPLVGGPPGVELHTVIDELPSGNTGEMVPVVLPMRAVGMVPNGVDDIVPVVVGTDDAGEGDGSVPMVGGIGDVDVTATAGVPGAICPVGTEQVSTVPGVVGSEASGTGASVVSGVPGCVVAENGLGPLSGDVTIVPGVDERPIAVLPIVDTCAAQASQPASRITIMSNTFRIAFSAPI
jgi:hypothetical protein